MLSYTAHVFYGLFVFLQLDSSKMEDFKEQINLYPFHNFIVFNGKSLNLHNDQNSNASKNLKASTGILFHAPDQSKMSILLSVHFNLFFCIDFCFLVDKFWKPGKFFNYWCTFKCSWKKDNVFVYLTVIKIYIYMYTWDRYHTVCIL